MGARVNRRERWLGKGSLCGKEAECHLQHPVRMLYSDISLLTFPLRSGMIEDRQTLLGSFISTRHNVARIRECLQGLQGSFLESCSLAGMLTFISM